jgi:hypothetical protein
MTAPEAFARAFLAARCLGPVVMVGCAPVAAVLDPPLAQLARWQSAAPQAIAAEPVACPPGHAACARLHARRAEACMTLALRDRAPGAACPGSDAHLACAAEGYAAARALTPNAALADGEAQARLCRSAFLPPEAADAEARLALRAAEAAPPQRAGRWRARAALVLSRPVIGKEAESCAIARAGLAAAPPASPEAADLARRIAGLPGCGEPR